MGSPDAYAGVADDKGAGGDQIVAIAGLVGVAFEGEAFTGSHIGPGGLGPVALALGDQLVQADFGNIVGVFTIEIAAGELEGF